MGIQRIPEFIAAVEKAKNDDEIVDLAKSEYDYLVDAYDVLSSRNVAFGKYRKGIAGLDLGEELKKELRLIMRLTKAETRARNDRDREKVADKNRSRRPIDDVDVHIDACLDLIENGTSYYALILGLCGATGRRTAEIAVTARFEVSGKTEVIFTGQLKEKTKADSGPYRIPVLIPAEIVVDGLQKLRDWRPNDFIAFEDLGTEKAKLAANRFSSRAAKELRVKCEKFFPGLIPKNLRAIYTTLAYHFHEDPTISPQRYASDILGHGKNDNETGASYADFYINDPDYL